MKKVLIFCMVLVFSSSLFAEKGILRISANMEEVDIYNGDEQIAMLGEGTTEVELEKGKYTITLRKPIDEYSFYSASKKVFVGANSMTRVNFKLEKVLTQKGELKKAKDEEDRRVAREKSEAQRKAKLEKERQAWNKIKNQVINHNGHSYKMVKSPYTGKIWLDRNLGASRVCQSSTDSECYGDLYQWGRTSDGHESRYSSTTSSLSYSDYPNHSKFIKPTNRPHDWRAGQNNNLWQTASGKSNPCPKGFRVPTIDELKAETLNQGVKNAYTAYKNFLKFPLAGNRLSSDGSLYFQGSNGYVWSSSVKGKRAWYLSFFSVNAGAPDDYRALGGSVRCLKN